MTTATEYAPGSEAANAATLDTILEATGLFNIHREVPGTLTQPRVGQRDKGMRIDRLLVPTDKLVGAGWTHGIIGIEIKATGVKLGPPISQAIDYSRSVFALPGGGFQVSPSWVFLYPFTKEAGPLASIMAQQRVGTIPPHDKWTMMRFCCGESVVLRLSWTGEARLGATNIGLKAGSR